MALTAPVLERRGADRGGSRLLQEATGHNAPAYCNAKGFSRNASSLYDGAIYSQAPCAAPADGEWMVKRIFPASDVRLSLIHISEPTRLLSISYAVFCLK